MPGDDQGALTIGWFDFQHNCVLRLLLGLVIAEQSGGVILETHEDVLIADLDGHVAEAVSVKHREAGNPWTLASILRDGGLAHLFETWHRAEEEIGTRLMTNARLASGPQGANRLMDAAPRDPAEPDTVGSKLSAAFGCDTTTAKRFLAGLTIEAGLPHRLYIGDTMITRFLAPLMNRYRLPADSWEIAYERTLSLVAEHSKDRDPVSTDPGLVAVTGQARSDAEREARIAARTITTEMLVERLVGELRPPPQGVSHYQVHALPMPKVLVRREGALGRVADLCADPAARVVAVIGIGGEGKSTVARQYVLEGATPFETTFRFSLRLGGPEAFLEEACRVFLPGDENPPSDPFRQARRLGEVLAETKALVLLDEFEYVLAQESGLKYGACESRDLSELLGLLLSAPTCEATVLLTSRIVPVDFEHVQGYADCELEPLDGPQTAEYLSLRGISGPRARLEEAGERFGRHALSLAALADFLLRSPRWRGSIDGLEAFAPADPDGGLGAVLQSYGDLLAGAERDVVVAIGASHRGLRRSALALVCEAAGIDSGELDAALRKLQDSVLLGYESRAANAVMSVHPLIAQHFVENGDPDRVRLIRSSLADFYEAQMAHGVARSVEEAQPGIAAFMQAVALERWDRAAEIYFRRLPVSRQLFWSGHYRICRALTDPLLNAWERGKYRPDGDERADLLTNDGRVKAKIGGIDGAVEAFDRAADEAPEGSAGRLRGLLYGVEVALEGGRCYVARERLKAARTAGRAAPDDYRVTGRMGYLEACFGNFGRAEKWLSAAIDHAARNLAAGESDAAGYLCLYLRVRADFFVRVGRFLEAHADIDAALEIAEQRFSDYAGHLFRTRGDAFRAAQGFTSAHAEYDRALRIARDSGYEWLRAEALIGTARLALSEGERGRAVELADEARAIAERGGWWLEHGRSHVVRGEAALLEEAGSASSDVSAALDLAGASGHHLLVSEARDLFDDWIEGRG